LRVLLDGVEAGEFRDLNPKIVVKPLLGALNWMTIWYRPRKDEGQTSREAIASETADFVMHGVARA
jgi:hypothetical protein